MADPTIKIANVCERYGADTYICGTGSDKYQNNLILVDRDIKINRVSSSLEYKQFPGKRFVPNLSIIDLLFHHGENALK